MSNFVDSIKSKLSSSDSKSKSSGNTDSEPAFSIQPHPAKSNDPADLQPRGGLRSSGGMEAYHARDPYVPSEEIRNNLQGKAASREELHTRMAELNKDQQ